VQHANKVSKTITLNTIEEAMRIFRAERVIIVVDDENSGKK